MNVVDMTIEQFKDHLAKLREKAREIPYKQTNNGWARKKHVTEDGKVMITQPRKRRQHTSVHDSHRGYFKKGA
jgi:hypothetical protein